MGFESQSDLEFFYFNEIESYFRDKLNILLILFCLLVFFGLVAISRIFFRAVVIFFLLESVVDILLLFVNLITLT